MLNKEYKKYIPYTIIWNLSQIGVNFIVYVTKIRSGIRI
uniref:Uncharacterized protein n=1 Tax=viral metagenome TaxID=1070528 RepID=A0A6C0ER04_9ZZZZ